MNFLQLNAIFLSLAALIFVAALWRSPKKRTVSTAVLVSLLVMVGLTVVFDNLMIASGLFDYAGETLNGLHIGLAPIEDFAYPLGGVLLLPGLWLLLTGRKKS
ncbi:lycopene cyclase domain-containing protein [Arthrobacter antibioticus]|uniref:lycopene cyclase domain-containing protein n=1 Tax=Arthrobacter sp. H35-MC1 TaxID=3046203 RepID=UPI0024B9151F|nr:lycopene cyclase domain-containing protein [Arthrobacter sp. H35-MC1]MDJ0316275.1 lycopene cyclase domain-containing protein [Arthrobacter sp. H35-MC1]